MAETENGGGRVSSPWELLARYGAWTVLVFYLLGAIPGIKSPVDRIIESQNTSLANHNNETARLLRSICLRLPERAGAPCD